MSIIRIWDEIDQENRCLQWTYDRLWMNDESKSGTQTWLSYSRKCKVQKKRVNLCWSWIYNNKMYGAKLIMLLNKWRPLRVSVNFFSFSLNDVYLFCTFMKIKIYFFVEPSNYVKMKVRTQVIIDVHWETLVSLRLRDWFKVLNTYAINVLIKSMNVYGKYPFLDNSW